MNKLSILCGLAMLLNSAANAQTASPSPTAPKEPMQIPSAMAQTYITNYKASVLNFFAHGYLLDIAKVKNMSSTAVRVYNGLDKTNQKMVVTPLDAGYNVNTNAPSFMTTDQRLCPKVCDIVSMEEDRTVSGAQIGNMVNTCMECRKYETVNAVTIFTSTLNALAAAGFRYVRIYNGQDASARRYVIYVPVDAAGKEVMLENLYAGDNTSVLSNCKYP